MTPLIKEAIGRLRAIRGDGQVVNGTAFLVQERYLLTAFHLVGDRLASLTKGTPICYPTLRFQPVVAGGAERSVRVVPGCCDALSDWALLELDVPMRGVRPLPLSDVSQHEVDRLQQQGNSVTFETWGFPTLAKLSGSGIALDGRVQDRDAEYQGAWAFQLYSDNVQRDPLNGLSGAPCLVDGAAVGIVRSNLLAPRADIAGRSEQQAPQVVGGILYACPLATGSLQERCARYLPALDPIRGLPGLPRQGLPAQPFRYLRWYGVEHAEVFFGRNRRLRDLYCQVTDADTPPVVLVYGATGVGKSSLLEAGLLPRLSLNYDVRVQRREPGKTLEESLQAQLMAAPTLGRPDARPRIILLDQIEEVFADPGVDGNDQLAQLSRRIKGVLDQAERPLRVLLGFRSEWLANVRTRMAEAGVAFGEFYLERLAQDEIEEVVRGVQSSERMRKFYSVEVDEGLPQRIAYDLLADPHSPVSPMLGIILTRLWEDARNHRAGEQRLSRAVYDERMRSRLDLDQFLTDQIREVAKSREEDVGSGLVNDVLFQHTTDQGTAREVSWADSRNAYQQLAQGDDHGYLRGLIAVLSAQSLLYSVASEGGPGSRFDALQVTRLAHDTLAPSVRKAYEKSDLVGQRARRILESRIEDWEPVRSGTNTLDAMTLAIVDKGARGMRALTAKEKLFIEASRRQHAQHLSGLLADAARSANDSELFDRALRYAILAMKGGGTVDAPAAAEFELRRAAYACALLLAIRMCPNDILCGIFAPDGHSLMTADSDGVAQVWDSATGNPVGLLSGHTGPIRSASFSVDGRLLVTASDDRSARVWEADPWRPKAVLTGHAAPVTCAVFSRDGLRVATASSDHSARAWDAATGTQVSTCEGHTDAVTFVGFAQEGKLLITASKDKSARAWSMESGKPRALMKGHEGAVLSAAVSPDGAYLATGSDDRTARLWDVRTGTQIASMSGHEGSVSSVAFSMDGRQIVTASVDGSARVWDAASGKPRVRLQEARGAVSCATFSPDGLRVATASSDGSVSVYLVATGRLILRLAGHEGPVFSAAYSPDGRRILSVSADGSARVWRADRPRAVAQLEGFKGCLPYLAFGPDGKRVAGIRPDGAWRFWDSENGRLCIDPDPAGDLLNEHILASTRDVATDELKQKLAERHEVTPILGMSRSADGKFLLIACLDRRVRILDASTLELIRVLTGHEGPVFSATFSSNGAQVVSASWDNTACLWDPDSGRLCARLEGHDGPVLSAGFSSDGALILTASADGTVAIWDSMKGRQLTRIMVHEGPVLSVAFSPQGERMITTSTETSYLWDVSLLMRLSVSDVVDLVTREKLVGASRLTNQDVLFAPCLDGRTGEDVRFDASR